MFSLVPLKLQRFFFELKLRNGKLEEPCMCLNYQVSDLVRCSNTWNIDCHHSRTHIVSWVAQVARNLGGKLQDLVINCHGNDGYFVLGAESWQLDSNGECGFLLPWKGLIGTIWIMSCSVAATEKGEHFMRKIAKTVNCDVLAAVTDQPMTCSGKMYPRFVRPPYTGSIKLARPHAENIIARPNATERFHFVDCFCQAPAYPLENFVPWTEVRRELTKSTTTYRFDDKISPDGRMVSIASPSFVCNSGNRVALFAHQKLEPPADWSPEQFIEWVVTKAQETPRGKFRTLVFNCDADSTGCIRLGATGFDINNVYLFTKLRGYVDVIRILVEHFARFEHYGSRGWEFAESVSSYSGCVVVLNNDGFKSPSADCAVHRYIHRFIPASFGDYIFVSGKLKASPLRSEYLVRDQLQEYLENPQMIDYHQGNFLSIGFEE
ncbi:uncharacterized protein LOC129596097 [Paramacrobiotus metropolitanus]|uniref:uncharacterized protein LOC129596097 n=1 Tax=Paramacrobiotus metropolitanus TaxID=2943436 RepID=UPI0024459253|nr:uncharacterized protein LOC129596097 [Paramacrobiotus metropolitanus]